MMIPYITTAVLTPLCGYVTDVFGKRLHIFSVGIMILLSFSIFYFFLPDDTSNLIYAYVPLFMFGFFNATLESIMWPLFPLIVEEKNIGLGFGCVSVINNVFLALVPLLNGWLHDLMDNYSLVMVSMGCFTVVGSFFVIWLYRIDGGRNGVLSKKQKFM